MSDEVSVTRDIAAPAEQVWVMVADVTRMGEWSPESEGATWLGGATGAVPGARFRGANRNGKKQWNTLCTVVDADPGQRFAFRVTVGGLKVAQWAYALDPTPTGCRVTETWTDQRGQLVKSLGKPVSGVGDRAAHNRQTMERTLAQLAAAAESSAGSA